MHTALSDIRVPKRVAPTRPVVVTTLYDLIAAVGDAIEPGEEDFVAPIVAHMLRAGDAQWLSEVDKEMLWDEQAAMCLDAEERCVSV